MSTIDPTAIGERGLADSQRWFPDAHLHGTMHLVQLLTLGLCAEAGEVANEVTRAAREGGAITPANAELVVDELADVAIYLFDLCALLQIDLPAAITSKRTDLLIRFDQLGLFGDDPT